MALRNILTDENPLLRKKSRPVTNFDERLHILLDDMRDTLIDSNGVGLAAPQVGILRRIFLVDTGDEIIECINPEIIALDGEQTGVEGCLSIPGKYGVVTRAYSATVRAQDRFGEWFEAEGEELIGRCFQHEYDHLEGILYKDVADRMLSQEELEELMEEQEDDE
ncbi:MAG: peptide deformylase [Oscillospiraceae bacterium]|nr:peptide deformylase [Oscillospiraceae bacterium]